MKKASQAFNDSQRAAIEAAITQAELRTSAEIVVVVATRSGRYDRAEDTFGLCLALFAVTVAWMLYQDLHPSTADWMIGNELTLGLLPVLGLFVLWAVIGAAIATRFPILARPFTPRLQAEAEVRRRGFEAFHLFRVSRTAGRNGVLIYLSMMEHMAWVVGDDAINDALPNSAWDEATAALVAGMKRSDYAQGVSDALSLCTAALAEKFPRQPDDTDELPNTLHFLD